MDTQCEAKETSRVRNAAQHIVSEIPANQLGFIDAKANSGELFLLAYITDASLAGMTGISHL